VAPSNEKSGRVERYTENVGVPEILMTTSAPLLVTVMTV
jgi:hypothetical protein